MKIKISLFLAAFCMFAVTAFGQAPKLFNYQGIARNANGETLSGQTIGLRISILSESNSGQAVFTEEHQVKTNSFGLFTLKIGQGSIISGSMDDIDWGSGAHYLSTEMDADNNGHYVSMGTAPLLSVPYALYAERSGSMGDGEARDIDFGGTLGQTIHHNGTEWVATSVIYNNGNNVGINTTSPSARLDVNGSVNITTGNELKINGFRAVSAPGTQNLALGHQSGDSISSGLRNMLMGWQAGRATTTGSNNAIIGYRAGFANTTGSNNNIIGNLAGFSNTTGQNNVFYGYRAGYNNTSGVSNFFAGTNAGQGNTLGNDNISLGTNSGFSMVDGDENAFIGRNAGYNTTTGNANIFIGKDAGNSNTTGSNNTYIGTAANGEEDITNATAIGANAQVVASNSVVLGNNANVGIGTSAPVAKLDVTGNIRMVDGNQQGGYILTSDTSGTMHWTNPANIQTQSVFKLSGTKVVPNVNLMSVSQTDFVFGSDNLDDDGNTDHDQRMFFDKSKAAFRAGYVENDEWDDANVGELSVAFGKNTTAPGKFGFALGRRSTASGLLSFAVGEDVEASGQFSVAMGDGAFATNFGSVAVGNKAHAAGLGSIALGYELTSPSAQEMTIGMYATEYTPLDSFLPNPADRLFTIGNGTFDNRSDAMVVLKNGNTGLGTSTPQNKLDVSGSIRMIDGNQQEGYIPVSDSNGVMVWTDPATVQTLSVFELSDDVVRVNSDVVNANTADFVFGSSQLDFTGSSLSSRRMFFDKSQAAFRAGRSLNTRWDAGNLGEYSAGFGYDTEATGSQSFSIGNASSASGTTSFASGASTRAIGTNSFAIGTQTIASGIQSFAGGELDTASGSNSFAVGHRNKASGNASFVIGEFNQVLGSGSFASGISNKATGDNSFASGADNISSGYLSAAFGIGNTASGFSSFAKGVDSEASGYLSSVSGDGLRAPGYSEGAIGIYNTNYSPVGEGSSRNENDRLFSIGNGTSNANRKNAMAVYTDGKVEIPTETAPSAGYVMTASDANGRMTWTNPATITTANDGDWTVSGNNIYSAVSGNIGIGTQAPAGKLHIFSSTNPLVKIGSTAGSTLYLDRGTASNEVALTLQTAGEDKWVVGMDNQPAANQTDFAIKTTNNGDAEFLIKSSSGNVGIGTGDPLAILHTYSDIVDETGGVKISQSGYTSYIYHNSAGDLVLRKLSVTDQFVLDGAGNVGIGTSGPAAKLEVNGTAAKPGGGSWAVSSDRRLKQDIQPYSHGLDKILAINPVTFHYNEKSGYGTEQEYVGVIAQELQKVSPDMVSTFEQNGEEYLRVDNSAMTYMLINAVKEQQQMLEFQKTEKEKLRENLEAENQVLKARLEVLEQMLNAQRR